MISKKKLAARIDEAKAEKIKAAAELEAKREAAKRERENLIDVMNAAEDPDSYRQARENLEKNEADIDFYNSRLSKLNKPTMSKEQYNEISEDLTALYNTTTADALKKITAKLGELNDLMSVYTADVTALDNMLKDAKELTGLAPFQGKNMKAADILNWSQDAEFKGYIKYYFDMEFKKTQLEHLGLYGG